MTKAPRKSAEVRRNELQAAERSEVRSAIVRFLTVGFVVLIVVAVPVSLWIRSESEDHALTNAVLMTQRLADYAIAPLITDQVVKGDQAAIDSVTKRLAPRLADGSIVRVKVWDPTGRVVYSEIPALIGQTFDNAKITETLHAKIPGLVNIGLQDDVENEFEAKSGELVEVHVQANGANGHPYVFEIYFDDDGVRQEQSDVLLGMAPVFLLSLGLLQLAQLIPAIQLARRIQGHQSARRQLLQHAIDASDLERQRIARDLHDEVIQDLAGLSYALEAEEMHSTPQNRALFGQAKAILQNNVRTLRAMTAELYPPDLEVLGLPAALARLAAPLLEHGIEVKLHVPTNCDLDRDRSAMFYRVAREVLANTIKHAHAGVVELTLMQDDDRTILLIHDNGCGFDLSANAPDNHLGLRIMRDTIQVVGGSLEVRSWVGGGTSVMATLGRTAPVNTH